LTCGVRAATLQRGNGFRSAMSRILHVHFKAKHNVGDAAVVQAVRQILGEAAGRISWSSMLMRELREEPTARRLRFIDSHDLVIIGGGGFCSKYALPVHAAFVERIQPPIVLFGIGHNRHFGEPALDSRQLESLAALGRRAALTSVRDRVTQQLLAGFGVTATLTGDPALYLAARAPWRVPQRRHPAIGINVACHNWTLQAQLHESVINMYRNVLRRLLSDCDPQLYYMVHTDLEIHLARQLRREFPALRICRLPADKLLYMYGRLDIALSMMLHASILACAAGTPSVSVAYDEKTPAFFADIGQSHRCFSVVEAQADAVYAACREALATRDRLPAVRDCYGPSMANFAAQIAALLGERVERAHA
jgi:polysaccharide pyruvyl transferase WcaK-like protein